MATSINISDDTVRPPLGDDLPDTPPKRIRGQGGHRTPIDGLGDVVSERTGILFAGPNARDKTRQEFEPDTDINRVLADPRVQAGIRPPVYGQEIDYDVDLLRAHELVRDLKRSVELLPPEVLERHGGVSGVIQAIANGSLVSISDGDGESAGSSAGSPATAPQGSEATAGG